ncbi:Putative cytochrome P450 [Septoria linicola]|uniref:Cytochrome P450 n=1 Tax=Septoria linicola TaxID=215465 RepID=A0A9Q9ATS0_9PEZI|nr:putative cytochrome P450 [Septoria linicola]USW54995.1 Putative cytochrome P450 [Septoria linicola]
MPFVNLLSAVLALLVLCIILPKLLKPRILRLPCVEQGPLFRRLLDEPSIEQIKQWSLAVPNRGLISCRGPFNQERIIVTDPNAAIEVDRQTGGIIASSAGVKKMLSSMLGDGVVTAMNDTHQASSSSRLQAQECSRCLSGHGEQDSASAGQALSSSSLAEFDLHSLLEPITSRLPYLSSVTSEALRLHPVVPVFDRITRQPVTLCSTPLPTGKHLIVPVNAINTFPQFWGPDAGDFQSGGLTIPRAPEEGLPGRVMCVSCLLVLG